MSDNIIGQYVVQIYFIRVTRRLHYEAFSNTVNQGLIGNRGPKIPIVKHTLHTYKYVSTLY